MSPEPPAPTTEIEAPAVPEGGVATRLATSVSSTGYGVDPEGTGTGVRFAGLRLAALLGVLAFVGFRNPWLLVVIVALLVMITLHELGHYLTAKRAGMKVTEFFLGFGPKIWSIRRGETEYGIKVIPAGAYVKIPGMVNLDEVPPEDEARTYRQKSFGSRVSVAVAGSAMHFMLALVLLYVALVVVGQPGGSLSTAPKSPTPIIERVVTGSGASKAGLRPGDEIRSINGKRTATSKQLRKVAAPYYGQPVKVAYVRDGAAASAVISLKAYTYTDDSGAKSRSCGLGVVLEAPPNEKIGPVQGLVKAPQEFANIFKISVKGLGSFFSPSGISSFGSQVGNAHKDSATAKQDVKQEETDPCAARAKAAASANGTGTPTGENRILSIYGLVRFGSSVGGVDPAALIGLFALINIFIGIFNLIPLLPFDGGHVAIAVYENIQERRLHRRRYFADVSKLLPLTYAVVLVLGMIFVSSLYLDVVNPIGG